MSTESAKNLTNKVFIVIGIISIFLVYGIPYLQDSYEGYTKKVEGKWVYKVTQDEFSGNYYATTYGDVTNYTDSNFKKAKFGFMCGKNSYVFFIKNNLPFLPSQLEPVLMKFDNNDPLSEYAVIGNDFHSLNFKSENVLGELIKSQKLIVRLDTTTNGTVDLRFNVDQDSVVEAMKFCTQNS